MRMRCQSEFEFARPEDLHPIDRERHQNLNTQHQHHAIMRNAEGYFMARRL